MLAALLQMVERLPLPPPPPRGRGRPVVYSDRLFLQAVVVLVVRQLTSVDGLLGVLAQPMAELAQVWAVLIEHSRTPSRRTWQRRLGRIPEQLPAQIACLGQELVLVLERWRRMGRAAAVDSTVLAARGGVWHTKHRMAGVVPHTSPYID
jgi:hypothetical protein